MYKPEPRVYLDPEPFPGAPEGFYKCSRYPDRYGISKDGKIWSGKTNKILDTCYTTPKSKTKYKTVLGETGIHRLLAETFLSHEHIPPYEKHVVNHIDGNRHNNTLDNIEWTTVKGNAQHAKSTGLLKNLTPLLCKNYYTGETLRFLSMTDACYELQVIRDTLNKYLTEEDRTEVLFLNKYIIIKEGEEWPIYNPDALKKEQDMDDGWLVLDRVNACASVFASASHASKYMGHTHRYIYDMYRKSLANGTHLINTEKYLCCPLRYYKEFIKDLTDVKSYIKTTTGNISRPIRVKDLDTGKFKHYPSLKEFAKEIGTTETALAVYLRKHKNKWKKKYKVKFYKPDYSKKLCEFITTPINNASAMMVNQK